jgi:hypothetical protein
MTSGSSAENPFKAIEDKFTAAYSPDKEAGVNPVGSNNNEFISGTQSDGSEIGIFRPNVNAQGGSGAEDALQVFSVITGDPTDDASEFVVGGDEVRPVGFEVLSREPFRSRPLNEAEMTKLARKIGSSTFH